MADNVVIKPAVAEKFDKVMRQGRVVLFSAPCGFGKSTMAKALLRGKKVYEAAAGEIGFSFPAPDGEWEVFLLDQLQELREESQQETLCSLIRENPDRRFVLLSRGTPPGWLMAFQFAGLMQTLDARSLLFDRETTARFLRQRGIQASALEINAIQKESLGYPLGVMITAQVMADGSSYSPEVIAQAYRELYAYFDTAVYRRFSLPIRRFLLELAPFESFDAELARMVSGDAHAGELLDWIQRNTTMLQYTDVQRMQFWAAFRDFLLWEMDREYTEEKRRALFSRGGLYYELRGDYSHALECYSRGADHAKVSELLIRNAELHPGMGHYQEMERYYRALPETEILLSPALMQGMSMLCALRADYSGSERWYRALSEFANRCERTDAARKEALSRMAWLDISLPQRAAAGLTQTISAVFKLLNNREILLPPFSVTSTLPSIMNGGKDFSDWSKKDDILYKTLRPAVEAVLGADGVGLADCAIAESKFEKGEDISARMLVLISRLGTIQKSGTPDIEFAAVGLLARSQLDAGQADDARHTVEALRARFAEEGTPRFLPNIDALVCRLALYSGDLDTADRWYREKAPRDLLLFDTMKRYRYLTQAMVELAEERPEAALMTLAPLEEYCTVCRRHLDGLYRNVLVAIACYRKGDEAWRGYFDSALSATAEFHFIRPISMYAGAVLPLLDACVWEGDERWFRRVCGATRAQAANYPAFLQPRFSQSGALTTTELQVLKLICANKSNAEIGEILDIKLATVKTHVSHVLQKLGVSRRSEVRAAAQKLWLISDEP